ncbi:MAG TPA: Sir2 family NAD-dependent protein deacetylase [Thermodesulfobacteriota bacterium]|nr:Sir2 family NAD-dependent protein deacetylase [Thermodesulfobacteriota bacterium]
MEDRLRQVAHRIVSSKRVIVFSGAGLSTESGIPDFRSPGGVWDRYQPEDFTFQNFLASETSRERYWQMATEFYEPIKKAQPNQAHLAIAELEKLGKLDCVITQNIDGLHFKAGNSEEKVIQLHGTAIFVSCLSCKKRYRRDEIQERIIRGQKAPRCDDCGGLLKPATISFGQSMPERETQEAYDRSSTCDLFIVVGSSLVVQPAASMPLVAKRNGATLAIINRDPTPYDDLADVVIHGQAGSVMATILEYVKKELGGGE